MSWLFTCIWLFWTWLRFNVLCISVHSWWWTSVWFTCIYLSPLACPPGMRESRTRGEKTVLCHCGVWCSATWHQGIDFTLVTSRAFVGRLKVGFQLGCHLQLCPRPHLQWPWLQVVRTCDCPQVIVSLRGQTLVTKGKYSGDTADNLFHRVIQPTPATMRTLIFHLSHKSLRIYNGHLALLYRGVWDILNQYPVKHYHSKNTTPTTFQSISGFTLPSVLHKNQALL